MATHSTRRLAGQAYLLIVAVIFGVGTLFPPPGCCGLQADGEAAPPADANAGPFKNSEIRSSTASLWEGDGIDYTLIIRYDGEAEPVEISLTFPIPYPTMLVFASPELDFIEDERELRWQGMVCPDRDQVFTINLVTTPESESSGRIVASAGIYGLGEVHWLQSETEIHGKPDVSLATVLKLILAYLVAGITVTLGIPWLISRRQKSRRSAVAGEERESSERIFLFGMSFGFFVALVFAQVIGFIAWQDYRRYTVYEQSTCTVLDKRIILEKKNRTAGQTQSHDSLFNEPQVAVLYRAEGREIIAAGPPQVTSMRSTREKSALKELARYERGRAYPCWYDPEQPRIFVLTRGLSWGWYLLGMGPLLLVFFLGKSLLLRARE